jgi:hypothetical protein
MVRDAAIRSCDVNLRPDVKNVVSLRWKTAGPNLEAIGMVLIPDVVDYTIFHLLNAVDDTLLRLSFSNSAGMSVDLTEEGLSEMAGSYMGSGGWRARYSMQRFAEDASDLAGV